MRSKRQRNNDDCAELAALLNKLPAARANTPFTLQRRVRGVDPVSVNIEYLGPEHEPLLIELLAFLFKQQVVRLSVTLEIPNPTQLISTEVICSCIEDLLQYPAIVQHTILWRCLIITWHKHTNLYNSMLFVAALNKALLTSHEADPHRWNLCLNAAEIYRLTKDEAAFQEVFQALVPQLIAHNKLIEFCDLVDREVLKRAIRKVDSLKKPLLIHYAMQTSTTVIHTIEKLFELLDSCPSHLIDDAGNTLMHVCRHQQYLVRGIMDIRDIYRPNAAGDYPIHVAARTGNLAKAQFLFKHMIDPEIKNAITGETFSTIVTDMIRPVDTSGTLNLYRKFKHQGVVISHPTVGLKQNGHTCGLYAVDCAARHHRVAKPTLFHNVAYLPPRKSDMNPKATNSLRQQHKSKVGEVLSVAALVRLVELTRNQGVVLQLESYEHFMRVIQLALRQDYPIILPVNNKDSVPHAGEDATSAHWVTIVGYAFDDGIDYLLFSQYGAYYQCVAYAAYDSCTRTQPHYPESFFVKDKSQNMKWTKYLKPPLVAPGAKVRTVPATQLTDFFGKMVVVLPPGASKEEVALQLGAMAQEVSKRQKC